MSRGRPLQNCNRQTDAHKAYQTLTRSRQTCVCMCVCAIASLSFSLSLSLVLRLDCTLIPTLYTRTNLSNTCYTDDTYQVIRAIFCVCIAYALYTHPNFSPTITPTPHRPSPTHLSQSGGTFSIDMWFDRALSASFFRFCDAMCRVYLS